MKNRKRFEILFIDFKYTKLFKYFRALVILSTLSILGSHFSCTKPSTAEPENQRPQIEVTEDITENTVWESGKDYLIKGEIVVAEDIILRINPNVNIIIDSDSGGKSGRIIIKGYLNASGLNDKQIIFSTNDLKSGSICFDIVEEAEEVVVNYCTFQDFSIAIKSTDTPAKVFNTFFRGCLMGIYLNKVDSAIIDDCNFWDTERGLRVDLSLGNNEKSLSIKNSIFSNCDLVAIELTKSKVTVDSNQFIMCKTGIYCHDNTTCILTRNQFESCSQSAYFHHYGDGVIEYNQFLNGNIFIEIDGSSYPAIHYNDFLDATQYKIYAGVWTNEEIIDASNNFWVSLDSTSITQYIFDSDDLIPEGTNGKVKFIPFLTEPNN